MRYEDKAQQQFENLHYLQRFGTKTKFLRNASDEITHILVCTFMSGTKTTELKS